MNLLLTYDVSTTTATGRRRLRTVARICEGYGQRVQYSVFEVVCSQTDFAKLVKRLEDVIDPSADSLRIYPIYSERFEIVMQLGLSKALPLDESWTL